MGVTPLAETLMRIGVPLYGSKFEKSDNIPEVFERLQKLIDKELIDKNVEYKYIVVTETWQSWKNYGYIFNHPNFENGTIIAYDIPESKYISGNISTAVIDGEISLMVGRHVFNGKNI